MLIDPKQLAYDYTYNDLVEREIGRLLSEVSGLPVSDFSTGVARPEYDFKLGQLPVELKITDGVYLPVEVSKTLDGSVPSGVAVSVAPYILYLSHGHSARELDSRPCIKVRMLPRKQLLRDAKKTPPSIYVGATESQTAVVHYLKGPFFSQDIWLGDMDFKNNAANTHLVYDTTTFRPSRKAGDMLRWLNTGYIEGDIG